MLRKFSLAIAVAASLAPPGIAFATSAQESGTLCTLARLRFCPAIISRPTTAFQFMLRSDRSTARQTLRQAPGMAAGGTISASRASSTVAGMAAVSVHAGLIRLSD